MARWPESSTRFFEEHPDPDTTDEVLFGGRNTLYAVDEVEEDGTTEVENLRTGEEEELGPLEYFGWVQNNDAEPLGIGVTPEIEERAGEVASAHQRSPRDTFEQQSKRSQQNDVARDAQVTDDTLLYNLNPDRYDFEGFDTTDGAARDVFDL